MPNLQSQTWSKKDNMSTKWATRKVATVNIRDRISRYFENRRAIDELNNLDDRTLRELGLRRKEIRKAVLGQL
ncbi:DUF1127 domain-containing protein [Rhizobium laguerreae]|uniref:DUF1127 domain-containing protein n=1 Tax=Rhizobium laguerreae TaxID=1076926 RepID=UPI0028A899B7|nr:DUF1127 domain-containing protein [Rhizobium laguerreae]